MKYNDVLNVQLTDTGTEPVTLAEAKNFCKIEADETAENSFITSLITVARKQCEGYLNQSIVAKDVIAEIRNDLGNQELPYGPVDAISEVKDVGGAVLVADDDYTLQGLEFKNIKTPCDEYLKVTYTTTGQTNDVFKTAILNQICFLYENRGDVQNLSPMVLMLLKPFKRVW